MTVVTLGLVVLRIGPNNVMGRVIRGTKTETGVNQIKLGLLKETLDYHQSIE